MYNVSAGIVKTLFQRCLLTDAPVSVIYSEVTVTLLSLHHISVDYFNFIYLLVMKYTHL